jgi:hypothetical protein
MNAIPKSILILLVLMNFSLIVDCQNVIKTFNLSRLPGQSEVKLSDVGFAEIDYIPLETKEQSLISKIDLVFFNDYSINKIVFGNGYFIIKNGSRVLKFREDGTFVAVIGKTGRGPGEINQIEDLDIDKETQNVYMVSGWQKKFYVYSPIGVYIRTFNVPSYVREFRFFEDKILCFCGNNRGSNSNSFILIDKSGHLIKSFPNRYQFKSKSTYGFTHENLFSLFKGKVSVKELYSDTIYTFENMEFKPRMIIDVGKKQVTPKVRSESDMLEINANYIQPMNLLEFGDFIYYAFVNKFVQGDVRLYGFVGSKVGNYQGIINVGDGINNDLDGGLNILPLTTKDDNTIVSLIDAIDLKKHVASEAFRKSKPLYPEKKKELEKLANSLKETDNPVLVLVRLKK